MTDDAASIIQTIEREQVTAVVRQSTQRPSLKIQDWRVSRLGGDLGNPVSIGLYRFAGVGQDGAERVNWSVVLKILQSPANVGWNYWRRELLIYQALMAREA